MNDDFHILRDIENLYKKGESALKERNYKQAANFFKNSWELYEDALSKKLVKYNSDIMRIGESAFDIYSETVITYLDENDLQLMRIKEYEFDGRQIQLSNGQLFLIDEKDVHTIKNWMKSDSLGWKPKVKITPLNIDNPFSIQIKNHSNNEIVISGKLSTIKEHNDKKLSDIFKKANDTLYVKYTFLNNFSGYCKHMKELFDKMTCYKCFLKKQDKYIIQRLLSYCSNFGRNLMDDDYLAMGIIYFLNDKEEESFEFLTKYIEKNDLNDLPYSLRASLSKEINPHKREDAERAVLLNPTARNYFINADTYDETIYKKSFPSFHKKSENDKKLFFLDKAIQLRPDFACVYKHKASCYIHQNQGLYKVVDELKKCVEIDDTNNAYFNLCHYLISISNIRNKVSLTIEALKYAKLGLLKRPNDIDLLYSIGVSYAEIGDNEKSIEYLQEYLNKNPDSKMYAIEWIEHNRGYIYEKKADKLYNEKKYNKAIKWYQKSLNYKRFFLQNLVNDFLSHESIDNYLMSLLKANDQDIEIDSNHSFYKKLKNLFQYFTHHHEVVLKENEQKFKLTIINSLDSEITFGKYKGKTLEEVLEKDPPYVLWCITNVLFFCIDKRFLVSKKFKLQKNYLKALELNLVKLRFIEDIEEEYTSEDYGHHITDEDVFFDAYEGDADAWFHANQ
jgi:tetratricopeptide (TPR) repeat protein